MHANELHLVLNDIEHRTTAVQSPQTNGFVGRSIRTVKQEFFEVVFHQKLFAPGRRAIGRPEYLLDSLHHRPPHRGYRNMGGWPLDTASLFQEPVETGRRLVAL